MSAQIPSGNSGGPLLNMRGEVVGVVEAKLDAARVFAFTGDLPENVGYAVKVAYLRPLLDSVAGGRNARTLPNTPGTLAELAKRVEPSALLVIAEGKQ